MRLTSKSAPVTPPILTPEMELKWLQIWSYNNSIEGVILTPKRSYFNSLKGYMDLPYWATDPQWSCCYVYKYSPVSNVELHMYRTQCKCG